MGMEKFGEGQKAGGPKWEKKLRKTDLDYIMFSGTLVFEQYSSDLCYIFFV